MRLRANENVPGAAVRMPMPNPEEVGERLAGLVATRDDWAGHFSVIEPGRVRMRPLG
jgi:hypothetical protein